MDNANVLHHMLDREDGAGVRLLIAAGANPNWVNARGDRALHWAVWRRRSPAIVDLLIDAGAEVDAPRGDGRTAYALAVESGQMRTAELLLHRGASAELPPLDRYLAACSHADDEALEALLRNPPRLDLTEGEHRMLPDLAMSHGTTAVRALLAVGVPVDTRGENGGTALHWACWKGYADIVRVLLQHGASLTIQDTVFHGTPPGWFGHGLQNCGERGGDYVGVARALAAAGAEFPAVDFPCGHTEIDAIVCGP